MHPRLMDITAYLASVRADLGGQLERLTPEEVHRAPAGGGWTVAQLTEHLGRVEGSTAKMLESLFARAIEAGLPADNATDSLVRALDKYDVPTRKSKIPAPEFLVPSATPDFPTVWSSLQKARERTLRLVDSVDGRDLTQVSYKHPIFGPLNGYEWILFIGQHEARHLDQMREVLGVRTPAA